MNDAVDGGHRRPTRRTVAVGAAWALPVIAVGAPARALAASGAEGAITSGCGEESTPTGTFTVDVLGLSSAQVRVILTYSGASGYLIDKPAHWLLEDSTATTTTFLVPVSGGAATGTATATFAFGRESGESGTLTAAMSATSGEPIAGRVTATLMKTFIDVGTYSCTAT